MKPRRAPPRHCRDARVCCHTTTDIHGIENTPPVPTPPPVFVSVPLVENLSRTRVCFYRGIPQCFSGSSLAYSIGALYPTRKLLVFREKQFNAQSQSLHHSGRKYKDHIDIDMSTECALSRVPFRGIPYCFPGSSLDYSTGAPSPTQK